jgi:hypothetical protein
VAGLRNPALQSRGGDGSLLVVMQRRFRDFLRPDAGREPDVPVFLQTGSGIKLACGKQAAATFPTKIS